MTDGRKPAVGPRMSYLSFAPDASAAAATDIAEIGSNLTAANAAAVGPTTVIAAAASDEVSTAVAALFGTVAQDFQAVGAQAAAFHDWFVRGLVEATGIYAFAESANASPLRDVARRLLSALGVPLDQGATATGGGSAPGSPSPPRTAPPPSTAPRWDTRRSTTAGTTAPAHPERICPCS